jgi:hypothetical protein
MAVLVAGPEIAPEQLTLVQNALNELAPQNNLVLQTVQQLKPEEIKPNWKVVIFLSTPPNVVDYANASPPTQFAAFTSAELQPTANLSILRASPEQQAFAAGFTSTVLAADWRAASLLPSDEPLGPRLADAFVNGGRYYCGRCASVEVPVTFFPLTAAAPANSDANAWLAAFAPVEEKAIRVLYISPEISNPDLINSLAGKNLLFMGGQTPPDTIRARWAVTIRPDLNNTIRKIWPDLVAGKGNQVINTPLELADINSEMLSIGRQQWIKDMLSDLAAGLIHPLTLPQ